MREEARTSLVEAFRAGDGTAFAYYLCFLSVVNGEPQSSTRENRCRLCLEI
jgi:hypothetical protein